MTKYGRQTTHTCVPHKMTELGIFIVLALRVFVRVTVVIVAVPSTRKILRDAMTRITACSRRTAVYRVVLSAAGVSDVSQRHLCFIVVAIAPQKLSLLFGTLHNVEVL